MKKGADRSSSNTIVRSHFSLLQVSISETIQVRKDWIERPPRKTFNGSQTRCNSTQTLFIVARLPNDSDILVYSAGWILPVMSDPSPEIHNGAEKKTMVRNPSGSRHGFWLDIMLQGHQSVVQTIYAISCQGSDA